MSSSLEQQRPPKQFAVKFHHRPDTHQVATSTLYEKIRRGRIMKLRF